MRPTLSDAAHLWDMHDAACAVLRFVGTGSFQEYLNDSMLQAAVERKIEIIGEAANRVSEAFRLSRPQIPWRGIIAQHHVLVHEYGEIDHRVIWNLVQVHIPVLIDLLEPLIPPPPGEDSD